MSQLFLRTLRDDPAAADVDSHRLLVRAGYIRSVASGIYSWLPLGYRVVRKVAQIVREEMDAAGAQELWLPILQPLELWERSGRNATYGPELFRLKDRKDTEFCLSPTAEEVITSTVAGEYSSYRDLPVNLYQINWKYRDELRPRFGVLRGREFLMKDAYSFDADEEGLKQSYRSMFDAYTRVFSRCGLTFRPVEGEAGQMGGDVNHEFMAVAAVGEDDFVWCKNCDYAANTQVATRGAPADVETEFGDVAAMEKVHTPDLPGIAGVAEFLGVSPDEMLKSIAFEVDGELGLALVPGDREVNPYALGKALAPRTVRVFDDEDFERHPEIPKGYIGPHFPDAAVIVADRWVRTRPEWVTGANEPDYHVRRAVLDRDFRVDVWGDIAQVKTGDPCPRCGAPLSVDRGIEVGQVFQLGTKYTEALDCKYTDEAGAQHPMVMGCYGIGVTRVVAAIAEEHHDDLGLIWPAVVAPFKVHLVVLPGKGDQAAEVLASAERLYEALTSAGVDVLYDDRDVSPGIKFADADLLGMPTRLTVGARGLARGVIERRERTTGVEDELAVANVAAAVVAGLG
ncbi:MAG: proline--tRNA ligase [Actinomycetota bacterium]|nr:proline--tRNA ligase [Actinomycetota bacterium]